MAQIPLEIQVACVEREIGFRQRVYPRWVQQGKMTQGKMDEELERMFAVRESLLELKRLREGGNDERGGKGLPAAVAR